MHRAIAILFFSACLFAQQPQRRPFVSASGSGSVTASPDQVTVVVSVTTQAPTAQDASSQNATKASTLIVALRKALGTNGDIKTLSIGVNPVTRPANNNQSTQIIGYSAGNSLLVTMTKTDIAGQILDVATQNSANGVGGLQFGLKNADAPRAEALKLATQQARAHAEAMAAAMGKTLGNIVSITESSSGPRPMAFQARIMTATPVEVGPLEVTADVVLEIELN